MRKMVGDRGGREEEDGGEQRGKGEGRGDRVRGKRDSLEGERKKQAR